MIAGLIEGHPTAPAEAAGAGRMPESAAEYLLSLEPAQINATSGSNVFSKVFNAFQLKFWPALAFVNKFKASGRAEPGSQVELFASIISRFCNYGQPAAQCEHPQDSVFTLSEESIRKLERLLRASDTVYNLSHEISPSVGGAPVGAGCDDPQPTEGEPATGAVSSPMFTAPVPPSL